MKVNVWLGQRVNVAVLVVLWYFCKNEHLPVSDVMVNCPSNQELHNRQILSELDVDLDHQVILFSFHCI